MLHSMKLKSAQQIRKINDFSNWLFETVTSEWDVIFILGYLRLKPVRMINLMGN